MINRTLATGQLLALRAARQRWERRQRQALTEPLVESSSEKEDYVERFANAPGMSLVCQVLADVETLIAWDEIENTLSAESFGADNTIEQVTQRLAISPAADKLRELFDPTEVDRRLCDAVKSHAQGVCDHDQCRDAFARLVGGLLTRPLTDYKTYVSEGARLARHYSPAMLAQKFLVAQ